MKLVGFEVKHKDSRSLFANQCLSKVVLMNVLFIQSMLLLIFFFLFLFLALVFFLFLLFFFDGRLLIFPVVFVSSRFCLFSNEDYFGLVFTPRYRPEHWIIVYLREPVSNFSAADEAFFLIPDFNEHIFIVLLSLSESNLD